MDGKYSKGNQYNLRFADAELPEVYSIGQENYNTYKKNMFCKFNTLFYLHKLIIIVANNCVMLLHLITVSYSNSEALHHLDFITRQDKSG